MSMANQVSFSVETFSDGDVCLCHYQPDGGRISVLDGMTGFGRIDVETGYRCPSGQFWLASGGYDIRNHLHELNSDEEMAQWVIERANNCRGGHHPWMKVGVPWIDSLPTRIGNRRLRLLYENPNHEVDRNPGELFHEMGFEIEIVDEASGEFVEVRSNSEGHPLRIDCSEWPFLRDAIDRMFEEIAEHESEGKLKKLFETPAPWDTSGASSEKQAMPAWDDGEWEPYDPYSNVLAAVEGESGWIPWSGGECPVDGQIKVSLGYSGDIIAYKVVD